MGGWYARSSCWGWTTKAGDRVGGHLLSAAKYRWFFKPTIAWITKQTIFFIHIAKLSTPYFAMFYLWSPVWETFSTTDTPIGGFWHILRSDYSLPVTKPQWLIRLKTEKNWPVLRLVPFFVKLPHKSPQKNLKSGNGKKIWPGWQGGSGKVQILPNMGLIFGFWAL